MRAAFTIGVVSLILSSAIVLFYELAPPRDLRLVSVAIVSSALDQRARREIGDRSGHIAIAIFTTKSSLDALAYNGVYDGIFVDVYRCSLGNTPKGAIKGFSLVYDKSGPIGLREPVPVQRERRAAINAPTAHVYHLYVSLDARRSPSEPHPSIFEAPEDICFVLSPFLPFVGLWPSTNEVRIGSHELSDAIARRARPS